MAEYDDPSLGQAWANILRGFQDPNAWQQTGQGIVNTAKVIPNVVESLGRGGVAQAIGTMGDLRDLRNTVQGYLPKSLQNFTNAAEFLSNPYAKALIQTAPTTESTLDFVPRVTDPYEGYKQHETLGEFIAPSLGYFGGKAVKATKGMPVGLSIEDVSPNKVAEVLRAPEKNELGYYSALDEAVANLQNPKGTGQQYLAQLLKTGGVKQEEIATRGLDNFLAENPKVSKEQIAQYLRENPVELKETVLGSGSKRDLDSINADEYSLGEGRVIDDTDYIDSLAEDEIYYIKNEEPDLIEEYRRTAFEELGIDPHTADPSELSQVDDLVDDFVRDRAEARAHDMYYDNPYYEYTDEIGYTVTGNDDVGYIIRDPNGRDVPTGRNGVYDISDVESAIREDALDRGFMHYPDDEYGTKYHDYTLPNGENYREVLIQYPNKRPAFSEKDIGRLNDLSNKTRTPAEDAEYKQLATRYDESLRGERTPEFESSHFDEPNILAHFRTTDRTIDGKKTLFVEEIQSDWHQAGRKKGYFDQKAIDQNVAEQKKMVEIKHQALKDAEPYTDKNMDAPQEIQDRFTAADDRLNALRKEESKLKLAIPDAPFKKNWQELAMKRAMQMAAEGGYDRVAFTTGKQQNERYNLARYLDEIYYKKNDDGTYTVSAIDKNHRSHMGDNYTPEQIEEHLGKDMAKKIVEDQGKTIERSDSKSISGEGLTIGGKGMEGFYDKILPDFINKYGKKHGLKVGQTKLPPDLNINSLVLNNTGLSRKEWDALSKADKERTLKELGYGGNEPVHYFDLTPEAKESFLKKGQPMFAVAPALGITDEDSRREILEKLFNSKK